MAASIGGLAGLYASGAGQGAASSGGGWAASSVPAGACHPSGRRCSLTPSAASGSIFSGLGELLGLTGQGGALTGIIELPQHRRSLFRRRLGLSRRACGRGRRPTRDRDARRRRRRLWCWLSVLARLLAAMSRRRSAKSGQDQRSVRPSALASALRRSFWRPRSFGASLLVGGLIGGAIGGVGGGLDRAEGAKLVLKHPGQSHTSRDAVGSVGTSSQLRDRLGRARWHTQRRRHHQPDTATARADRSPALRA